MKIDAEYQTYQCSPGEHIQIAIAAAISMAKLGRPVKIEHNSTFVVTAEDTPAKALTRWERQMEAQAEKAKAKHPEWPKPL